MTRRLQIVWYVLTGRFITGYIQIGEKASAFALGGIKGMDVVLASVSLAQQASRLKDIHTEHMIDDGYAKSASRLNKDWTMWLDTGLKQPYLSPAEFVDLIKEKGDE